MGVQTHSVVTPSPQKLGVLAYADKYTHTWVRLVWPMETDMKFKENKKYEKVEKKLQAEGNKSYIKHEKAEVKNAEKLVDKGKKGG